ncbi:type IV pilus biogenesis protein PilM [Massilia endophytica]|uniref:type IV pilus biogenesis protein PilM n=1 Tax=Massilia endophytica TaxID=2899220 RepID=UPI0027D9B854|nr:pilus assembly protein PilM [Massilia endophytica]
MEIAAFTPAGGGDAAALEKLGRELRASNYRCGTLLAMGDYQVLAVDAPNVPQEELKTAVRWRLKDMLDFHVDDATIDVLNIPVNKNAPSHAHQMFVIAARNAVVQDRQNLFVEAEAGLSVIDIPEMAQRNITKLIESDGRGVAMLSFEADGGLLTVCAGGELYLTRRMDVTLDQLMDPDPSRTAGVHDRITLELQRSLDHFDRQYHYINLSRLVLAPNNAVGLHEYLAQNLYMPVEKLNLADVLDMSASPELLDIEQQRRFFRCLGAALRREEVEL